MAEALPSDLYPREGLVEEEQIIEERSGPARKAFDARSLQEPIQVLPFASPLSVTRTTSVAEAIRMMQEHHVGCVLVQEADRLVGIFTERDVLNKVAGSAQDPAQTPVETVMTGDPEVLPVEASISFALNLMSEGGFRHLPLVDEAHRPVGMLSVKHVVRYLAELFPEEVLNLPPQPELLHPGQVDGG
ncbi:MAG: CBS domain-containing protein [Deltaproteobacteria bacterium]|nr:CBS domain-containing protein [Deltaproteobacteria bacterium]